MKISLYLVKHGKMDQAEDRNREILQKIKEKSDDDFEKNITFISAGALGISMTFIEKIVNLPKAIHLWIIITAWGFLTLTLLANLLSHYLSSCYHLKAIEEYDARNKKITRLNLSTIFTLILGIILLIIFLSINFYNMGDKNQNQPTTESKIPDSSNDEKKGRTITKPATDAKPTTDSTSQQSTKKK
jgi:hypothetical protein